MKKIPFDLTKWLQDKSQKVVTRDGKSVRIVCTDSKADQPIVALITHTYEGGGTYETIETYNENGHYWSVGNKDADLDLFLVTEDELTEFEAILLSYLSNDTSGELDKETMHKCVKARAEELLSIARKQIVADGYIIVKPAFLNALANCDPSVVKEVMEDCTGTVKESNPNANSPIEEGFEEKAAILSDDRKRKPSPALTRIVENLTPEKLEQTKKEMAMEREEKDDNGNIVLSSFLQGYLPKIMEKYGLNDTQKGAIVEIAYDFYSKGKSEALKDLPKWKIAKKDEDTDTLDYAILFRHNGGDYKDYCTVEPTNRLRQGDFYLDLSDLEKLPKE